MKPSIGRIVLFHNLHSNTFDEHPAIVNHVWSDICVNLTVFPDCGILICKTSVTQDEEMKQEYGWRWPPRVE